MFRPYIVNTAQDAIARLDKFLKILNMQRFLVLSD
jgi:hypothetical protein